MLVKINPSIAGFPGQLFTIRGLVWPIRKVGAKFEGLAGGESDTGSMEIMMTFSSLTTASVTPRESSDIFSNSTVMDGKDTNLDYILELGEGSRIAGALC